MVPRTRHRSAGRPDSHIDTGALHQACPLSQKRFRLKLQPYTYPIRAVHVQHIDGRPAHGRETNDTSGLNLEVLAPGIGTGVEEAVSSPVVGSIPARFGPL